MSDHRSKQERCDDAFSHAEQVEPIIRQAVIGERADAFEQPTVAVPGDEAYVPVTRAPQFAFKPIDEIQVPISMGFPGDQPNPNTHRGLPVAGYKKEQPAWAVELVNQNKVLEELVQRQIDAHKARGAEIDQRHVAIAKTQLEQAFSSLNRAVFQPERLVGELATSFISELGASE